MSTIYDQWTTYAIQRMVRDAVDVKQEYTVRELVEDVRLRRALKDVWFGFFAYMQINNYDRMGEALPTFQDVSLYTTEFIALLNTVIQELYDSGRVDMLVHVSPVPSFVETRTILNLDDIAAGRAFEPIYDTGSSGSGGGGSRPPILEGG